MDHNGRTAASLLIGGRPADRWLDEGGGAFISRVIDAFSGTNPEHHGIDTSSRAPDIEWVVERNLERCAASLRLGAVRVDVDEDEAVMASAARRAAEGSSLEALLAAYHLGIAEAWRELVEHATPADVEAVGAAGAILFEYLGHVSALVTRGFQEEREQISNQDRDARFALYSALIAGQDAEAAARRAGLTLPSRYLVLSLVVEQVDQPADAKPSDAIADRRRVHRLQRALWQEADGEPIALLGRRGGTVLLPFVEASDAAARHSHDRERVARLGTVLQAAAGGSVTIGAAIAVPDEVHEAAAVAEELLALARGLGRAPGVYLLDDLLLEYQVSRPTSASGAIGRLLDGMAGHDELLRTLEVCVHEGFDRRRVAHALHVHPNTVDYRLGRIMQLTGLDAGVARDREQLVAAFVLRRLGRARPGGGAARPGRAGRLG